jgi:hypothetical protein
MGKITPDFEIAFKRYVEYTDKGVDAFVKSLEYPLGSDDRQIFRLMSKKFHHTAFEYLERAGKILNG